MSETAEPGTLPTNDSGAWLDASVQLWRRWREGEAPQVEEVIGHGEGLSATEIGAVLRVDQEERWRRGKRVMVEEYLQFGTPLNSNPDEVLNLIYREFVIRVALDEEPDPDEYLERFPDYAPRLRRRLLSALPTNQAPELPRKRKVRRKAIHSIHNLDISADTSSPMKTPPREGRPAGAKNLTDADDPSLTVTINLKGLIPGQIPARPDQPGQAEAQTGAESAAILQNLDALFPDEVEDDATTRPDAPTTGEEAVPPPDPASQSLAAKIDELFPDEVAPATDLTEAETSSPSTQNVEGPPSSQNGTHPSSKNLTTPSSSKNLNGSSSHDDSSQQNGSSGRKNRSVARPLPQVENYEILGELGRGGMGVVYKARDLRLKRVVALKMILAGSHASAKDLDRFRAEAEAVARLHHPNIVQIYEVSEHASCPYLALEYVAGKSLAQRLHGVPMSAAESVPLIEALGRAVQAAHEAGIIHRDLKPANVLMTSRGDPKITDFGLAKQFGDDVSVSRSGNVVGTPSYMAPEQAWGKHKDVCPATDVYALGAILYEMITGRPPFRGATAMETIEQIWNQDPVPPRQLQTRLPRDIETICLKCLAKEPAKRYATAQELVEELGRFSRQEPIRARPIGMWERAVKWGRRRPAAVALMAMSFAVLVGLVSLTLWHNTNLSVKLDKARKAEKQATVERHLATLREEVQKLLSEGQGAFQERNFREAQLRFTAASSKIGSEKQLNDLQTQVQDWLERTRPQLADQEAQQESRNRLASFRRLHQDALLHATLFSGDDPGEHRATARAAAEKALGIFGVTVGKETPPVLPAAHYTPAEKTEILGSSYELLLLLAEPPINPNKEALQESLRILTQASGLGLRETQALHLRRARCCEGLGDMAEAAKAKASAEALKPASALEFFLLGDELFRRGELTGAIRACDRALHEQSNHFPAQYLIAVCYLKAHRLAEAKVSLNACLSLRSDFVWLYLLRGHVHSELNDFESAARDFQAVVDLKPDGLVRYGLLLHRGTMNLRDEKADAAVADFREAITLQPKLFPAYVNLARALQKQGSVDQAIEQYTLAIQQAPGHPSLYRNRGQLRLGRSATDALADFRKALELEAVTPLTANLRADDHVACSRILRRANQPREAVADCDAALELAPEHADAHRARGEALFDVKDYAEAIKAFDQYLKRGKPDAAVYFSRGLAKAKQGNSQAAIIDYSQALELKPDAYTHAVRGWAYVTSDQIKAALPDFDEAVRLDPKNGFALSGRGYALAKLGRYQEGVANTDSALRASPEAPGLLLTSARTFALAVARIDADAGRLGRAGQEARVDYQDRAVQLLRRAVDLVPQKERGTFWDKFVHSEPDLKGLRSNPIYAQLDREQVQQKK